MARWGKTDFRELQELQKRLEKLQGADLDSVFHQTAQKIAQLLLNRVKKRTPAGIPPEDIDEETYAAYWAGYTGGTLRDAWDISGIEKQGDSYVVTVANPTEYASFVEYGHRQTPGRYVPALGKQLKKSWVPGQFMLTLSVQQVERAAPGMLEKAIEEKLREVFQD